MIHPHTELKYIGPEIGYGVVATSFIPAGTVTWVLDALDRSFSPQEYTEMSSIYQGILDTYTFRDNRGHFVLCWDHGRYVNHSFNSNCLTTAYDFEIAIRDIEIGEQLTDDYGYLNITEPFRGVDEGTKRKIVYPNDLLKYGKVWDKKLSRVFHRIPHIEQPLRPLIEEDLWNHVMDIIQGRTSMDSITKNYFIGK